MAFAWVQPLAHTQCWCNVVSVSTAGCYLKEHPFSRQSKALTVRMFGFCYWFFSAEYWMHSWGWILNLLNMTSICFLMKETRVLICEAKVLRQFSVMSHFSGMNENFQNGQYLKTPDLSKSQPARMIIIILLQNEEQCSLWWEAPELTSKTKTARQTPGAGCFSVEPRPVSPWSPAAVSAVLISVVSRYADHC